MFHHAAAHFDHKDVAPPYREWETDFQVPIYKSERITELRKAPRQRFTRLNARITQEYGAFTVRIQLHHHLSHKDLAGGEEPAPTIEVASMMIAGVAEQFDISESNIALTIHMENFKDGTWH